MENDFVDMDADVVPPSLLLQVLLLLDTAVPNITFAHSQMKDVEREISRVYGGVLDMVEEVVTV